MKKTVEDISSDVLSSRMLMDTQSMYFEPSTVLSLGRLPEDARGLFQTKDKTRYPIKTQPPRAVVELFAFFRS